METKDYLSLSRDAYESSTAYVDANYRKRWEDSLRMFQSKHPADSKYNSDDYRHRSRLFRPKSRSAVRRNESAAAVAYFSNYDVVNIEASDPENARQAAGASLMKEVLNHRLNTSVPWFVTLLGAFQDAQVQGVVVSHQYWRYKSRKVKKQINGPMGVQTIEADEVVDDRPCIDLIPVENIRFSPAANWVDPIGTSPYVIWMIPMYVGQIKANMRSVDGKTGAPKWRKASDTEILAAIRQQDSTASVRDHEREDRESARESFTDYDIAWVRMVIMRDEQDSDVIFWTLGGELMLTDPVPLSDVYKTGDRPFVMGIGVIESHRVMPESYLSLGEQLQREANEIVNQRMDNVKLVLNKRWMVRSGRQVDIPSLLRNVPGSVTMVSDPGDVQEVTWPDVTSSAYAEQDRVNVDFDELLGNFSQSSVMTNRQLNETVGGMGMISQSANAMTEYLIRTFTETWVEPVLRQLVKLEQLYESDDLLLSVAAKKARLFRPDIPADEYARLMQQDFGVRVNVGMGATDPNKRIQRILLAVNTYAQMVANLPPGAKMDEIGKEIFGAVGYRDGERFFDTANPKRDQAVEQLQGEMQKMAQEADQKMQEKDDEIARLKADKNIDLYEAQTKRIDMLVGAGVPVQIAVPAVMGTEPVDMMPAVPGPDLRQQEAMRQMEQQRMMEQQAMQQQPEMMPEDAPGEMEADEIVGLEMMPAEQDLEQGIIGGYNDDQ